MRQTGTEGILGEKNNDWGQKMSMQHGIRANLQSDREQRIRFKQRAGEEAFGVYRPLTPESKEEVKEVLGFAVNSINTYLGKNFYNGSKMKPLDLFGVTFVQHTQVRQRMRAGLFQRGFERGRMINGIERHAEELPSLTIPIEDFGWFGARWDEDAGRKLAARLDVESLGYDVLKRQADAVGDMLRQSNGTELKVEVPSHVSLMRYGRYGDRLDLNRIQRRDIRGIVEEHFDQAALTHVELGRLIIGTGYEKPIAESLKIA